MSSQILIRVLLVIGLLGCFSSLSVEAGLLDCIKPKKQVYTRGKTDITGLDGSDYFMIEYANLEKEIEKRVTEHINDLDPMIEVALDLYEHPKESPLGDNPKFIDSLRLFMSLKTLTYENQCTAYSAQVLLNNYLAAFGREEWGYERNAFVNERRVNKVIKRISKYHAETCAKKYLPKFDEASKQVDPKSVEVVNKMLQHMIAQVQEESKKEQPTFTDAKLLMDFSGDRRGMFLDMIQHPVPMIALLTDLAKDDPELKSLTVPVQTSKNKNFLPEIEKSKVERIVNEYMVTPCKTYMKPLEGVFEPAEFDTKFQFEITPERIDYYQAWARYRYCTSVVEGAAGEIVNDIVAFGSPGMKYKP